MRACGRRRPCGGGRCSQVLDKAEQQWKERRSESADDVYGIIESMQETIGETERKVIDILTKHPVTDDAYLAPIQAVDRAMGWATLDSTKFVNDLRKRGLIHLVPIGAEGPRFTPKFCWKEGPLD